MLLSYIRCSKVFHFFQHLPITIFRDKDKNEVIKICLEDNNFLDALQLLINKIFRESRYPKKWKTELIKPIQKKRGNLLREKL